MKQKPTTKKINDENADLYPEDAPAPESMFSKTDKFATKFRRSVDRLYDLANEADEIIQDAINHAYHVGIVRGRALTTKSGEKRKAKQKS